MRKLLFCFVIGLAAANLNAQVNIAATSGTTTGTYTTLKGAFDAINAGTHQGAINISITASTTETATAVLNASGGTASYTSVAIKPATGATPTISGSLASSTLVRILGSNITLDGSNAPSGTTRDLTFTNTSTTAPQVINFVATTPAAANTNIVVKNLNIINGINTSTAFIMFDGNATPTGGYFNNVTIQNNAIKKSYIGIYLFTAIAAGNGANTLVTGNDFTATGTDANRLVGVYLQGLDGATVSNNTIGNFETANAEIKRGIWFATGTVNSSITSNTITNLNYTGTGGGGATGITVTSGNTGASAAANVIIRSNNINNFTSSGTGTIFSGIYVAGTGTNGVIIDKNKVSAIKNTNVNGYGAQGIYVASTSAAANTLVSNNIVNGVSGYGYASGGGVNDNGSGIVVGAGGGYKIYYNTVVMDVNQMVSGRPAAFNALSTVTAAGAIDLRNNIFVNSQTQVGEKYVLYSGSANTIFSNINYNDYYSSGTNLGFIGFARAGLADIQAGFGGNVNSINVLPAFVSATDFHLATMGNTALDNKGTPVAEVTVDADGNARSATTPDLGGFEFTATVLAVQDAAKKNISYYPNPVTDYIYINYDSKIKNVEVYNMAGQKIINGNINAEKGAVDMRNAAPGAYILKVNSDKNTQSIKIIKR
ncbi:Por secretion system C-terminal sorting domain-containing protein [Chryseobacterium soldanellicola]|uniref:Por secretion system C-terminal sorting domain-containing protein n=1 Tax=Chryseobacterium soldanellicola TaxID=311333 RepID=A0A1H1DP64_9FLAO|nr:T9SS type A sorting domain-containing protein [Chryseobacterium soldanellicola]SDQ78295.1 Por secretion system C-terminal sorting domain-containing protein [Chryseobacterium soldanellicola]